MNTLKNKVKSDNQTQQQLYDLWEDDEQDNNQKHVKTAGKSRRRPKYVPSLLPAVVPPSEGASYNPPLDSYLEFVTKVAADEKRDEAKERRLRRKMDFTESGSLQGLQSDDAIFFAPPISKEFEKKEEAMEMEESKPEPDELIEVDQKPSKSKKLGATKKKRQKAIEEERQKRQRLTKEQQLKMQRQQLDSLKSLGRKVRAELAAHDTKVEKKRMKRTLHKFGARKRLGRGRFEPPLENVLVPAELPSSLRELPAAGESVFRDRLKSLQLRNIVPIAGDRQPRGIKTRLRQKLVEKRAVRSAPVTSTSRVI